MTAKRIWTFDKVEGLGNDFVLLDAESDDALTQRDVRALCDRRLGVGADGVLMVLPARAGGDARMRVWNADGTVPEMCGNGLRCVALHVARRGGLTKGMVVVETDAGLRRCEIVAEGDDAGHADVDMGAVRVVGTRTLEVGGVTLELTLADAGNPHAIAVRANPAADIDAMGLRIATHPSFPHGTNVEFVMAHDDGIQVEVWERGAGRTLACGTGACAVVAALCARGEAKSGSAVRVRLPGGELSVTHDVVTGVTHMRGPARRVFHGAWSPP